MRVSGGLHEIVGSVRDALQGPDHVHSEDPSEDPVLHGQPNRALASSSPSSASASSTSQRMLERR